MPSLKQKSNSFIKAKPNITILNKLFASEGSTYRINENPNTIPTPTPAPARPIVATCTTRFTIVNVADILYFKIKIHKKFF